MKVLIVSETLNEGGAEMFVLRLARRLLKTGIDVTVLNMNAAYENKMMTAQFPEVPIRRMRMPFVKLFDKLDEWMMRLGINFSLKYFFQSRTIKKKFSQYDIIHTNYSRIDHLFARVKKKTNSFRHLVTVHGDYSDQYYRSEKGERAGWLQAKKKIKFITGTVDEIVVVSEEQRSFFTSVFNVPPGKLHKIYHGFESSLPGNEEGPGKDNHFVIGMVARGAEQKGWQLLIDAFLRLPAGCKLVLVGGGKYLDGLKEKYNRHTDIIFTGFHSSPVELIRNFDVFVLPSLYPYESLPNSIIEALYCGKPVIASRVGEIEAMITDDPTGEKAGYVIDVTDTGKATEELFRHLLYLYEHPGQRKTFSAIAYRCFNKFRMDTCATAYMELYKKMI